jgi:hypothetical protein
MKAAKKNVTFVMDAILLSTSTENVYKELPIEYHDS